MTEQQIEVLVQKYTDSTASPEEVEELMDWYRKAAIGEVVWTSDNASERNDVYRRMLQRLQDSLTVKRTRSYWMTPLRAAAVFLLIIGIAGVLYLLPRGPVTYSTIKNSSGQTRQVLLPDGSTVWLNAATTLRYVNEFSAHRQIQLDGEAYFDVAHDPARPFTVEAGGIGITVLGTRFTISAYTGTGRTIVSLLQGKISVANAEKELAVLKPGTQLTWQGLTKKAVIKSIDTTTVVAWKLGRLQFQGQPLSEIVQTLERWYNVHIRFANPDLGQCRYYLNFDSNMPLKDLLEVLSDVTKMDFSFDKQTVVVSGKGCQ
jgi:transmembrane sensor